MSRIIPLILLSLIINFSQAQITNFNTEFLLTATLEETSGLIYYNNKLISHNDSGGNTELYEFSTSSNVITRTITINNAINFDWEDIAQDDNYIYIGDFGNNSGQRVALKIYRISKADYISNNSVTADIIEFSYGDQVDFTSNSNTNFDCEAMVIKGNEILLFSKNHGNNQTSLYTMPKTIGTHVATNMSTYNVNGMITGATYNPTHDQIFLTGYNGFVSPFILYLGDFTGVDVFGGTIDKTNILGMGYQVESIANLGNNDYYITNEKLASFFSTPQKLHSFTSSYTTPIQRTLTTSVTGSGSISPNGVNTYNHGTLVSISATANAGWVFDHWSGDASGSTNPIDITMDADKTITAIFIQTLGPGSVFTNNEFWVKAGSGISLAGSDVSAWADQSGNGNDALQAIALERPSYNNQYLNYNPSIYFDGTNENLDINNLIASGSNEVHVYAVGTNETGGDTYHTMVLGQSYSGWQGGGYGITAMNGPNTVFGFWVTKWNENRVMTTLDNQTPAILEGKYDGANVEYLKNSESIGTDVYTGTVGDNGSTYLGGGNDIHYNHKGYISEVAIYSSALSSTDQHKINSYFGLKYSITQDRNGISGNYINASETSIYSDNGVDTYWNQIIGIGRQDDSELNQKQSKTFNDSTRVYLSTLAGDNNSNLGTFSSDNQYIVMGHNNGEMEATGSNEFPSGLGVFSRIGREWQITNTNFTNTFSLDFKLNSSPINPADLRILIDNDGDFSTGATLFSPTITINGNVVTVSNFSTSEIPINSSKFITIASLSSATPLPIELLTFEPIYKNNSVEIKWQTATEINNNYFTIERSSDGIFWDELKRVKGANNSSEKKSYLSIDNSPKNGLSYYRLKQTDYNGMFSYSDIKSVMIDLKKISKIKIYPNPTNGIVTIKGSFKVQPTIHIYDLIGKKITNYETRTINGEIILDLSNLEKGIYFLSLKVDNKTITSKIKRI